MQIQLRQSAPALFTFCPTHSNINRKQIVSKQYQAVQIQPKIATNQQYNSKQSIVCFTKQNPKKSILQMSLQSFTKQCSKFSYSDSIQPENFFQTNNYFQNQMSSQNFSLNQKNENGRFQMKMNVQDIFNINNRQILNRNSRIKKPIQMSANSQTENSQPYQLESHPGNIELIISKDFQISSTSNDPSNQFEKDVIQNSQYLAEQLWKLGESGSYQNHIIQWDLRQHKIIKKELIQLLQDVGINIFNNQQKDQDVHEYIIKLSPLAVTNKGMGQNEMNRIAQFLSQAVQLLKLKVLSQNEKDLQQNSYKSCYQEGLYLLRDDIHDLTNKFIYSFWTNDHFQDKVILQKIINQSDQHQKIKQLMQQLQTPLSKEDRMYAALFGLYVADAVAMPVHWMYNLDQLKSDYGEIKGYRAPKEKFQGSIMNLSNTGGGGRGSDQGDIVGDVILHGKKKFWGRGLDYHYHVGLKAGENTLEAQLTRLITQHITDDKEFKIEKFREMYMKFMQTPGSHNDTYAATAHRMFFKNFKEGKIPSECPDNDGHNVDAIDALTIAVPVILKYSNSSKQKRDQKVLESIKSLRAVSKSFLPYAIIYSDMLVQILNGVNIKNAIEEAAQILGYRSFPQIVKSLKGDPMAACYINDSFQALLFIAYKYSDCTEKAILANANAGGENVARGALLGALFGAQYGINGIPKWAKDGLLEKESIDNQIKEFILSQEN